ncbi:MAG: peptidoglycan DD-metalloendopeptidase family protein [Deltaproteobacteria bacterium]|nr:peptidoglycan DD-metalloendopeptidase family protein [Deltaproteobacteria bacterium]
MPRLLLAALVLLAASARAQPVVTLSPAQARPGDAFLVEVRGAAAPVEGTLLGRTLQFFPVPGGWRAVAALPIEAPPGPQPLALGAGGQALPAAVEVLAADFPERRLRVASRFVAPQPARVRRRIAADQKAFERAYDQEPSPPLFSGRFALPRDDELNARYGERRTFNGKKPSRHYGLDIGGDLGAPVAAAQGGRVVLVRDCWGSGLSVVLFHGAGMFSSYFHLARVAVKEGAVVARGQLIGSVGRSGRVTGPHLHFGVKVGDLHVDPESVLRLPFD